MENKKNPETIITFVVGPEQKEVKITLGMLKDVPGIVRMFDYGVVESEKNIVTLPDEDGDVFPILLDMLDMKQPKWEATLRYLPIDQLCVMLSTMDKFNMTYQFTEALKTFNSRLSVKLNLHLVLVYFESMISPPSWLVTSLSEYFLPSSGMKASKEILEHMSSTCLAKMITTFEEFMPVSKVVNRILKWILFHPAGYDEVSFAPIMTLISTKLDGKKMVLTGSNNKTSSMLQHIARVLSAETFLTWLPFFSVIIQPLATVLTFVLWCEAQRAVPKETFFSMFQKIINACGVKELSHELADSLVTLIVGSKDWKLTDVKKFSELVSFSKMSYLLLKWITVHPDDKNDSLYKEMLISCKNSEPFKFSQQEYNNFQKTNKELAAIYLSNSIAPKTDMIFIGRSSPMKFNLLKDDITRLNLEARFRVVSRTSNKTVSIAHINALFGEPVVFTLPQMQSKGVYNLTDASDANKNKMKLRFYDEETTKEYSEKFKQLENYILDYARQHHLLVHGNRSKYSIHSDGIVLNAASKTPTFYHYHTGIPLKSEHVAFREIPFMVDSPCFTISLLNIVERLPDGSTHSELILSKKLAQVYCDVELKPEEITATEEIVAQK
jgi:hypothetical protein